MWRIRYALQVLKDDRGIGVVEVILILVGTDRTCDHLQITAYQSGADNIRKDYQRKFRNLSVVSTGKKEMTTGYVRGEVTVYLTLTFILFVSLVLALTESASIQMAKNYRRADMNRAVECVFAEYQKELLEHYDVFAIEAGYESGTYSEQNLLDRLSYYGADMENDIKRIRLFTDQNGELFMDQAGKYMKHKYGISWGTNILEVLPSGRIRSGRRMKLPEKKKRRQIIWRSF